MSETTDGIKMAAGKKYPPTQSLKLNGPPGTGKTTQLLERVTYLLSNGYDPSDITFVTYRTQMASEFLLRLFKRGYIDRPEAEEPWSHDTKHFGTIHGVCNRLTGHTELPDSSDKQDFIEAEYGKPYYRREDMRQPGGSDGGGWGEKLFDAYNWAVNNNARSFVGAPALDGLGGMDSEIPDFNEFEDAWTGYMVDYGDPDERLQGYPSMLREVRDREITPNTDVVVVDEYHDMTPIMDSICRMWFEQADTVIVVGDPSLFTSIDLPEVVLDKTYRVPENIWEYAKTTVNHTTPSVDPAKSGGTVGETPLRPSSICENRGIDSIMFLSRTRRGAQGIASDLSRAGIIYRSQERAGGWNVSNTLLSLYNCLQKLEGVHPADHVNPENGQTAFARFESDDGMESVKLPANVSLDPPEAERFVKKVPAEHFSSTKTSLTSWISAKSDLKGDDLLPKTNPSFWNLFTNGAASVENLLKYGPKEKLKHALERNNNPIDSIQTVGVPDVLTIHGAKGKEADTVVVEDGITPAIENEVDLGGEAAREESRVWYVAVTRAADTLLIDRSGYGTNYLPEPHYY